MDSEAYLKLVVQTAVVLINAGETEAYDVSDEVIGLAVASAKRVIKAAQESAKAGENTMSKNQESMSVEEFAQLFEGTQSAKNSGESVVAALAEHYRAEDEAKKKELGS